MVISRICVLLLLLAAAAAWSREAATPLQCQAAAAQVPIAGAIAKAAGDPQDIHAQVALADAWSDAGCFGDAVGVLEKAVKAHPGDPELNTRLRVAKSLVGEEVFFADLDRADLQAKLKRDVFRCESLGDLDACTEAARLEPDDPELLTAFGDALLRAKRPADALQRYRRVAGLSGSQAAIDDRIRAAEAALPAPAAAKPALAGAARIQPRVVREETTPRRYSNVSPSTQSH